MVEMQYFDYMNRAAQKKAQKPRMMYLLMIYFSYNHAHLLCLALTVSVSVGQKNGLLWC
jgi:hypothetical protein